MVDKEQILIKHFGNYAYRFGGSGTVDLFECLDEYAKHVAIDFIQWVHDKLYSPDDGHWYPSHFADDVGKKYTSKELFDLYLSEQQ